MTPQVDDADGVDSAAPVSAARDEHGRRQGPPPWFGRALWGIALVAILGPFLVFPVPIEAGRNAGDTAPLARIVRAFDRALAVTAWGDGARLLVWSSAGVALVAAFALLWLAFSDEG
jgi:hypothetical protein